jgi:hypothetical protein
VKNLLKKLKKETLLKSNLFWKGSEFEYLINTGLSSDNRGKWGENFINKLINAYTDFNSVWLADGNTSHNDGSIFDILINKYRTEIKTATSGMDSRRNRLTYTFQHENIYEENIWDKLILLDVEPSGFYITVLNHSEMVFGDDRHPILEKKSTKHLSAWKFDTSLSVLKRGIENGLTIYLSMDEIEKSTKKLSDFLNKHFS